MNCFSRLLLVLISLTSLSLLADVNVKSYPASLCRQTVGPENGLMINNIGDISNTSVDTAITLLCPVVLENQNNESLEVQVQVVDQGIPENRVSCQVGQFKKGSRLVSAWGNRAKSADSQQTQTIVTRISSGNIISGGSARAYLSCTLPPKLTEISPSLISYKVTQSY